MAALAPAVRRELPWLIVLPFGFCPPGEPAVNTPDTLALKTFSLGGRDQDGTGFIADHTPESFTVCTQRRFIYFFSFTHIHTTILKRS